MKDREFCVQYFAYSIFASLLQTPISKQGSMDNMSPSLSMQTYYPFSLKLILTKYKPFIDEIFSAIQLSTSSKVRSFALQCLILMLYSYGRYKEIKNDRMDNKDDIDDVDKKQEEKDDEENDQSLDNLMEKHVLNKTKIDYRNDRKSSLILGAEFIIRCLEDNTGDAVFFASVCELLQVLIRYDTNDAIKIVSWKKCRDRLKYLLQIDGYISRYKQHMTDLNIPKYLKSSAALNDEWDKFNGELKIIQAASSVLDVFNEMIANVEGNENNDDDEENIKRQNMFITQLMRTQDALNINNCIKSCIILSENILKLREWTFMKSIYNFYANLCKYQSKQFRQISLKMEQERRKQMENWCSNTILRHSSKCLESCDELTAKSICDFLYEITKSYDIDSDKFTSSYYRNYNVNKQNPSISSPYLLNIINYLFTDLVEKAEILDYDIDEPPFLLIDYYETLGQITAISTMSKIILCYHCKIGDFVKWITTRLAKLISLFIGIAHTLDQKKKTKYKKKPYFTKARTKEMDNDRIQSIKSSPHNFSNMKGSIQNSPNKSQTHDMIEDKKISNHNGGDKQQIRVDKKPNQRAISIAKELCRVLNLIKYVLYLAPTEIKSKFVDSKLGEMIIKLYDLTLYHGQIFNELHDMLLSVCVNFAAHCNKAKYVLCYGQLLNDKMMKNNNNNNNIYNKCDFILKIKKEAFLSITRKNAYELCFEILDCLMFSSDGINILITNYKSNNMMNNKRIKNQKNKNLLDKCLEVINVESDKHKHRRKLCMKLLRNLAMHSSIGSIVLIKYFLPKKWMEMIKWLNVKDIQFINICCEYFRNLSFITEFKIVFASNDQLLNKIYQMLINCDLENEIICYQQKKTNIYIDLNDENIAKKFKLILEIKVSLIMVYWNISYKKSENVKKIKEVLGLNNLNQLIKRMEKYKEFGIKWNDDLNDIKILLNSLLDRCKHVNKLLVV